MTSTDVSGHLLDLVPGRSGHVYKDRLAAHGKAFRHGVEVATLAKLGGCKNATDNQLAGAVLDAFQVRWQRWQAILCASMQRHVRQVTNV